MSNKEPRRGRPPVTPLELRRTYGQLDDEEKLSYVAKAFCEGNTPSQIAPMLSERFGEDIRREEPYRLLQLAALKGYFHYSPPLEATLGERIRHTWRSVTEAHVVKTQVLDDVTARAAEVLLALIREAWASKRKAHAKTGDPDEKEADTVRIGLAGGRTVLGIVRALAELLKRTDPDTVPKSLGFHTACAGIHQADLSTDPNAFVAHLLEVPGIGAKTFAVPYQAPPVTKPALREMLAKEPPMVEAKERFDLVDMIVTGGSSWRTKEIGDEGEIVPTEDHVGEKSEESAEPAEPERPQSSQLMQLMKRNDEKGYLDLVRAETVADMLWQPLSFKGPVDIVTDVQAMTLMSLRELPDFIEHAKRVLLVLGPYGADPLRHKGDVLLAALGGPGALERGSRPQALFTHLVCDHRTARAALKASEA